MKKTAIVLIFAAALAAMTGAASAQQKNKGKNKAGTKQKAKAKPTQPQTWKEKAAARLKPVTTEQKNLIRQALPGQATVEPKKDRRVLVFWRCETFIHTSIPHGNYCLEEMGRKARAFKADFADEYSVFTRENLAKYDAVIFNNTTSVAFENDAQRDALMDFVKAGKGIVGIHAAGDSFYKWKLAASMIGGQFNGHPWTAGGTWAFKLNDPTHPLNKAFAGKGFWHQDEIYQYKPETYAGEENLRILVSLDMAQDEVSKILDNERFKKYEEQYGKGPREVPVSWLREFEGGRVFYSNLGHREETYWNPTVVRHFLDGIQYALGDLEAEATPTSKAGKKKPALAPAKK